MSHDVLCVIICRLHLCRVPIGGQRSCDHAVKDPSVYAKPIAAPAGGSGSAGSGSAPPSSRAGSNRTRTPIFYGQPITDLYNLTGLYPWLGLAPQFDYHTMAAQGREAVAQGQAAQVKVVGASQEYSDYITGFMRWIERETPRYSTPKLNNLPPLPEQYKEDVMWVANLRRGPYPDLIRNRPQSISPRATDPLQNGQIANLPPGEVFAGRPSALTGGSG